MQLMRALVLILLAVVSIRTQTTSNHAEQVRQIQNAPKVQAAFDYIDRNKQAILAEWIQITEVHAPSGHERRRAQFIEDLLRKYKLESVRYDGVGNLIAVRKGTGGGPAVVFDAHLDTVFQPGLKIKATVRAG